MFIPVCANDRAVICIGHDLGVAVALEIMRHLSRTPETLCTSLFTFDIDLWTKISSTAIKSGNKADNAMGRIASLALRRDICALTDKQVLLVVEDDVLTAQNMLPVYRQVVELLAQGFSYDGALQVLTERTGEIYVRQSAIDNAELN